MLDQNPLSRAWAALTTHTPLHTLVYAVVGAWLIRFVYTTFLYARFFSPLRKMPGPSYGHWLLGRLPEVVTGEAGSAVTAWTEQYGRSIRFMGMLGGASRPPDLPLQRQLTLRWLAQVERVCFLNYKDLKQILVDEPYSERVRAARRVTRLMLYLRPLARVPEAVLGSQSVGNNSWIWIINARKCRAFGAAVRLLQSP